MNDERPAFTGVKKPPMNVPYPSWISHIENGMSLRDWFAGMALPRPNSLPRNMTKEDIEEYANLMARYCYAQADAMLKESNKE